MSIYDLPCLPSLNIEMEVERFCLGNDFWRKFNE